MTSNNTSITGMTFLKEKDAKKLISQWRPGDSVVIEVSAEQFAERDQDYLPPVARWTFEGLYKEEERLVPQFICMDKKEIAIHTVRFSYSEIKEGGDDGHVKALRVAPWPDVLPNQIDKHLPISGGVEYRKKYSLLNRIEINARGELK